MPGFQESLRANLEKQVANGKLRKCADCGDIFGLHLKECPKCSAPTDPAAPRRTLLIRTYRGGDVAQKFQADAMFLNAFGWRPQTHSAGGVQAGLNLDIGFGLGIGGGRKAKDMTVTYTRD